MLSQLLRKKETDDILNRHARIASEDFSSTGALYYSWSELWLQLWLWKSHQSMIIF